MDIIATYSLGFIDKMIIIIHAAQHNNPNDIAPEGNLEKAKGGSQTLGKQGAKITKCISSGLNIGMLIPYNL